MHEPNKIFAAIWIFELNGFISLAVKQDWKKREGNVQRITFEAKCPMKQNRRKLIVNMDDNMKRL